jgi:hypothetical protein
VETKETIIKEVVAAKEASKILSKHGGAHNRPEWLMDEPQVSVGGLLDNHCGNNMHENPKYGRYVHRRRRKKERQEKSAQLRHI